jgi:hypothetical protein
LTVGSLFGKFGSRRGLRSFHLLRAVNESRQRIAKVLAEIL